MALLQIAAYLDPRTFQKMHETGKAKAKELILKNINVNDTVEQNQNNSIINRSQSTNDPLDLFLANCGVITTSSSNLSTSRKRSLKEEPAFYIDRVKDCQCFDSNSHITLKSEQFLFL